MLEIFSEIRYFERGLSKPVSFNDQDYEKQKGPAASDQLPFRLQNKFRKILLLVMYCLV